MAVLQIHNLIFCSILTLVQSLKWTHHVILDRDRMFHLSWTPLDETIQFEMQVRNIITQCGVGHVRIFFSTTHVSYVKSNVENLWIGRV